MMKHIALRMALGLAFTAVLSTGFSNPVTGFNDLNFWGTGSNQAALVIDFQDGKTQESFAWGYRFDGSGVTGAGMLIYIADTDPNLTVTYSGTAGSGFFLSTISYFDGTDSHNLTSSYGSSAEESTAWGYYLRGGTAGGNPVSGGGSNLPATWELAPTGASDRAVADGSWDAWSYGGLQGLLWEHDEPPSGDVFAAAIPEPEMVVLLLGGLGVLVWMRRLRARG